MGRKKTYVAQTGGNSAGQLRAFIERIERMTEEKKAAADDIREIFAEAKGNGFDPKVMRIILRRRARDAAELQEEDALVETYASSLGMSSPASDDSQQ